MLTSVLMLVLGFIILIKGADWLVEGASSIARRMRMSDLMIGLTIVSFGTSAPELLVNIIASVRDSADIAIGNIVGSNISNTLLILGITAMVAPLTVHRSTVIKEIPFGLLAAATLFIMANDMIVDGYTHSELSRSDGLAFLGFFIIFIYYTFGIKTPNHQHRTKEKKSVWLAFFLFCIGLIGLAIGGKLVVDGAITIAMSLGMSESLVGLTIVALGTSLPELAASVMAAYRGRADIAVGNIIGSNIFNIFWILGISAIIKPLPFQPAINLDLSVVFLSSLLLFFLIHRGHIHHRLVLWWKQKEDYIINRWEGGVLFVSYFFYLAYVVWRG